MRLSAYNELEFWTNRYQWIGTQWKLLWWHWQFKWNCQNYCFFLLQKQMCLTSTVFFQFYSVIHEDIHVVRQYKAQIQQKLQYILKGKMIKTNKLHFFKFIYFATRNLFTMCIYWKNNYRHEKYVTRKPKRNHWAYMNWASSTKNEFIPRFI